jgi:hypothetical protein
LLGRTASVDTAGLERELVISAANKEVETLVVVVLVGVCRAASLAAALDVVVCRAAGGRHLSAGVAGATARYVAGAGIESSIFNGSLSDDRSGKRESDGRDQGEDREELHCYGEAGRTKGGGSEGSW